jgi:membrane protease YdiL (CAAX protease family)
VKRFITSEIGAAVIWVFASLTMAALLAPWIYQGGKHLAAAAETGDLPGVLEWLGASCGRAKFGRFFDRALLISALAFLPLLLRRIKALRAAASEAQAVRKLRFSGGSIAIQIVTGCLIAGGLLWALGGILEVAGAYHPKADPPGPGKLLPKILIPAVVASLLEEWVFRGLILGLWLRFARPLAACIGTSLLFAFLHFLKPPSGTIIADPTHPLAGFDLLGKILLHFTDPMFFVTDFATLLAVGLILAMARVRTGALWFSIGLHAGWIMAFKAFNLLYQKVPGHPLFPWGVGDSLRSGALPLVALGVTCVICHFALKRFPAAGSAAHHGDDEDFAEYGAA